MNFKKTRLAITLSVLLQFPAIINAQNNYYEAGHEAMHKQQFERAYEQFKKAESEENYADSSLYWQSYALFKINRKAVARRALEKLLSDFPSSRWVDDAKILALENGVEINHKDVLGSKTKTSLKDVELDQELRLFTIQQLMFQDPENGLSLAKGLLEESDDPQIKSHALQLMGISGSKDASRYLYEFIVENEHKKLENTLGQLDEYALELNRQAIQMLGLSNGQENHGLLKKLYEKSDDKAIKSSIIQGFIHASDHKQLLELMKKEKDQELNEQMIRTLGVMGAKEALREVAGDLKGQKNHRALLDALALSGDDQSIKSIIKTTTDVQIKIDAIRSLIILDAEVGGYLLGLYNETNNKRVKQEIINVLANVQSDSQYIMKLIAKEQDVVLKNHLIQSLMVMGDEKSLLKLLSTEKGAQQRNEIIKLLGVAGGSDELQVIYNGNINDEEKHRIIEAMGLDDTVGHEDFFYNAYSGGDLALKQSVVKALMISGNNQALIYLLKGEKSSAMKKNLIQALSINDPEYLLNNLKNITIEESNND